MSYTPPTTRTTGTLITASIWNTDMVDNFSASWVGTTAGDIDYYASATTKARLAIPADGYGLFSNGTIPGWQPGWKVIHHDTSDSTKACSDCTTSDALVFSYVLPANALGASGELRITGVLQVTSADSALDINLAFGSSNSSDGVIVADSSDVGNYNAYFDVAIIAKGSTAAQKIIGKHVTTENATPTTVNTQTAVSVVSTTIDTTSDNTISLLTSAATAATGTFTLTDFMITYIPYYTT